VFSTHNAGELAANPRGREAAEAEPIGPLAHQTVHEAGTISRCLHGFANLSA
jgi:hypothetical protein